jgi:hypothetical protein
VKRTIRVLLFAWGLFATVAAAEATTPVATPTPGPCCVDGVCRPKRETWGWYSTRWRRWPGDDRPPIPGLDEPEADGALPPDIPRFDRPEPEEEERRAPPPVEPQADAGDGLLPPLPTEGQQPGQPVPPLEGGQPPAPQLPVVPQPGLPDLRPQTPLEPGGAPGTDLDAPPALPFGQPPGPVDNLIPPGDLPIDPRQPLLPQKGLQPPPGGDAPPVLPAGIARLVNQPRSRLDLRVSPASARVRTDQDARAVGAALFTTPAP